MSPKIIECITFYPKIFINNKMSHNSLVTQYTAKRCLWHSQIFCNVTLAAMPLMRLKSEKGANIYLLFSTLYGSIFLWLAILTFSSWSSSSSSQWKWIYRSVKRNLVLHMLKPKPRRFHTKVLEPKQMKNQPWHHQSQIFLHCRWGSQFFPSKYRKLVYPLGTPRCVPPPPNPLLDHQQNI